MFIKVSTNPVKFVTTLVLVLGLLVGGYTYLNPTKSASATGPAQILTPLEWQLSQLDSRNMMHIYTFSTPDRWMLIAVSVSPDSEAPYALLEIQDEDGDTNTIGTLSGSGFFCIEPNSPEHTLTMIYNPDSSSQSYGISLMEVPEELAYVCASVLGNSFDESDADGNTAIGVFGNNAATFGTSKFGNAANNGGSTSTTGNSDNAGSTGDTRSSTSGGNTSSGTGISIQVDANLGGTNNPLLEVDANLGGNTDPLLEVDANLGGTNNPLLEVDANLGGNTDPLLEVDANLGGNTDPLLEVDTNLGGTNNPLLEVDTNLGGTNNPLLEVNVNLNSGGSGLGLFGH